MHKLTAERFWQYSLARYKTQDIAALALLLQDNHGVNVNVMLLICWCIEHGVVINFMQLKTVIDAANMHEAGLVSHREKRKLAHPDKGGDKSGYEALKAQELVLEQHQQADIVNAFNSLSLTVIPTRDVNTDNAVLNASIASFINVYALRENAQARSLFSTVLKQLPQREKQ